MKNCIGILFIVFLSSISAFSQKGKKTDTLFVKTQIYCDHCLECGSCAGNINTSMAGLYGIKKVEIQPAQKRIIVIYNSTKTTPDKIREAISSAGFDADNVLAKPDAVAKLDGCCKKN